jgi:hypothetical protein
MVAGAGGPARSAVSAPVPQVAPPGTAVLTGVVVTEGAQSQPVRRATVRLARDGMSARLVGTDDDGRFVFDRLPAGSYTLSAAKTGYVTAYHGSSRPGRGPGIPVAVTGGERVTVTLAIVRGGVITGTIVDAQGLPAPGVPVLAVDVRPGATATAPVRAVTDDRGIYRIFGLPSGDYVVSAVPALRPAGRGRAAGGDIIGVTDAEVRWARSAAASTAALPPGGQTMPPPGRAVAYAPVFHPGTADAAAAARVSVAAGEERAGVDLSLRIVTMARVSGTIVDAAGRTVESATVSLYPRAGDEPTVVGALVSSGALVLPRAVVTAEGFTIAGVAPGEYTIVARSGSGQRSARPPAGAAPGAPALWNVTDLSVDGSDRTDLILRLVPGLTLAGSVAFDPSSLAPPADVTTVDLALAASRPLLGTASSPRAFVNPDGTFRFSSLAPGTYLLRATLPHAATGAQWTLKSAIVNGRDLADRPLDATSGGSLDGLVVTFTDRTAEVSGRLIDAAGRPVTRYSIVVCTVDRTLWLPGARRIRSARPATDGSFAVTGLPAGEYAIAAVEDLEDSYLADPAFLARLLASAYTVTLADGERKRQDLKVGR